MSVCIFPHFSTTFILYTYYILFLRCLSNPFHEMYIIYVLFLRCLSNPFHEMYIIYVLFLRCLSDAIVLSIFVYVIQEIILTNLLPVYNWKAITLANNNTLWCKPIHLSYSTSIHKKMSNIINITIKWIIADYHEHIWPRFITVLFQLSRTRTYPYSTGTLMANLESVDDCAIAMTWWYLENKTRHDKL